MGCHGGSRRFRAATAAHRNAGDANGGCRAGGFVRDLPCQSRRDRRSAAAGRHHACRPSPVHYLLVRIDRRLAAPARHNCICPGHQDGRYLAGATRANLRQQTTIASSPAGSAADRIVLPLTDPSLRNPVEDVPCHTCRALCAPRVQSRFFYPNRCSPKTNRKPTCLRSSSRPRPKRQGSPNRVSRRGRRPDGKPPATRLRHRPLLRCLRPAPEEAA